MQTLTLSGWTQPSDALAEHIPGALTFDYSDYPDAESAIAALRAFREVPRIVAWSLGGQLALRAIAAGALAPERLILIAPPFQFVKDDTFPHGMSPVTFEQFRHNYATDADRTKERFHGLIGKGHRDPRAILRRLRHHPEVTDTARWLPWLDGLGRDSLSGITLPPGGDVTLLHGVGDAIVPVGQADYIRALLPEARYEYWEETGHAPHLEDTQRLLALLQENT